MLKRLSYYRRALEDEKGRLQSRLQGDLHPLCSGLLDIPKVGDNLWLLRFITSVDELTKLSRLRFSSLLKIPGVARKYVNSIGAWQSHTLFSHKVE